MLALGSVGLFRPCFTAPTFRSFLDLVVGLIAQARRRIERSAGCSPAPGWTSSGITAARTDYSVSPAGRVTGKIAHARELAELIAARYPDHTVHVVGDAAYVSEHLRNLGSGISWTSRLKVTSVLHELPPPRTGRSGRPRTRGARLGTPTDLAASATAGARWRDTRVRRYGRTYAMQITEIACLWYGSFRSRAVRVILVRDGKPRTRDRDDRGYGLPFVPTGLESTAEDLVARYASRWKFEHAVPWNGRCRSG